MEYKKNNSNQQNLVEWDNEGDVANAFEDLFKTAKIINIDISSQLAQANNSHEAGQERKERINLVEPLENDIMNNPACGQTNNQVGGQVNSQAYGQTNSQVGGQTNSQMGGQMSGQMNAQMNINNKQSPKNTPKAGEDAVLVTGKAIDTLAEIQGGMSDKISKLEACNRKLQTRVAGLSKINRAKDEKIKKLEKERRGTSKAEIGCWHNELTYFRTDASGVIRRFPICKYPFASICRMVDYTDGPGETYIVIDYINSELGSSIIDEKKLYKPGLLHEIKAKLMQDISVDGIPDTKLSSALAEFLQRQAGETDPILLFPKAGWEFETGRFYILNPLEDIYSKIRKQRPELPVLKRFFKPKGEFPAGNFGLTGKMVDMYQIAIFGSVLMSLLRRNEADIRFAIWIPDNLDGKKFARQYFNVWAEYQARFDIKRKKEMEKMVRESKDEPVIINVADGKEDERKKISELLEDFFANMDCIEGAGLEGLPVVMSENYFRVCERLEKPYRMIPLIPNDTEDIFSQAGSADFIPPFIEWCERNYSVVNDLFRLVVHVDELFLGNQNFEEEGVVQETVFLDGRMSGIARTFCAVWLVITAYRESGYICVSDVIKKYFTKVSEEVNDLLCDIQRFYEQSSLATFRQWLKECLEDGTLGMKNNSEVREAELSGVVVYGRKGEVYLSDNVFEVVLRHGGMCDVSFMLTALAAEGVIQTEAKGNSSVTYKPYCSVPAGCGNQQKRMVKFLAGVLMDEEGAEFGGELL